LRARRRSTGSSSVPKRLTASQVPSSLEGRRRPRRPARRRPASIACAATIPDEGLTGGVFRDGKLVEGHDAVAQDGRRQPPDRQLSDPPAEASKRTRASAKAGPCRRTSRRTAPRPQARTPRITDWSGRPLDWTGVIARLLRRVRRSAFVRDPRAVARTTTVARSRPTACSPTGLRDRPPSRKAPQSPVYPSLDARWVR
jgi:hypothetical protein